MRIPAVYVFVAIYAVVFGYFAYTVIKNNK